MGKGGGGGGREGEWKVTCHGKEKSLRKFQLVANYPDHCVSRGRQQPFHVPHQKYTWQIATDDKYTQDHPPSNVY